MSLKPSPPHCSEHVSASAGEEYCAHQSVMPEFPAPASPEPESPEFKSAAEADESRQRPLEFIHWQSGVCCSRYVLKASLEPGEAAKTKMKTSG